MYLELIDQLSAEKKRTSMLQSSLASLRSQTPKSQTPKSNKVMEKKMKKLEQEVKQLKKGGLKDQSFKSQIRILTGQANGLKSKVDIQSNKIETLTAGLKNLLGKQQIFLRLALIKKYLGDIPTKVRLKFGAAKTVPVALKTYTGDYELLRNVFIEIATNLVQKLKTL